MGKGSIPGYHIDRPMGRAGAEPVGVGLVVCPEVREEDVHQVVIKYRLVIDRPPDIRLSQNFFKIS